MHDDGLASAVCPYAAAIHIYIYIAQVRNVSLRTLLCNVVMLHSCTLLATMHACACDVMHTHELHTHTYYACMMCVCM